MTHTANPDKDGFRIQLAAAGSESAAVPSGDVTIQVHSITGTATVEVSAAPAGRSPAHWEPWDKGAVSVGTTAIVSNVKQVRLTTTGAAILDVAYAKVS